MRIDGKQIAQEIFDNLQKKGITPHLVIILVGDDPASVAYVRQKELKAIKIGVKVTVLKYEANVTRSTLLDRIKKLNSDPKIHGIIVQRPLPDQIDGEILSKAVDAKKDVDAFLSNSPYTMPLAAAVIKILENVYSSSPSINSQDKLSREVTHDVGKKFSIHPAERGKSSNNKFIDWLKSKNIVVIGKGETGGGPTIDLLKKMGVQTYVIDSKTKNPIQLTKNADIIISAVGRKGIVTKEMIKQGVILIAVGMYRGDDGKLHGDYEENNIKEVAGFYTPVPGGVGPVNVAMLLKNVIESAST